METDLGEGELRRRTGELVEQVAEEVVNPEVVVTSEDKAPVESETDDQAVIGETIGQAIGQDKPPEMLELALSGLPTKWKNYIIRFIFTWVMIGGFGLIIYGGPLALMITVFCVQVKVANL